MTQFASSALIAVVGLSTLTGMTFGATAQSRQIAAVVLPWQTDGLARAAATGLAIVDTRWNGRIFVLDTGGDPAALARASEQGFWLLDAVESGLCDNALEGT